MELDYPIWTIRPNWRNGILERLEWLTDVLPSDTGVEQRRSPRASPRRSFEFTVNPLRSDRTFLDLALHRLGSERWMVPLWHDQAVLQERAVVGAQALMLDNTFREFEDAGYAILYRDTFAWEVVEIQSQGDGALILAVDVETEWPKGTRVYPLRRMWLSQDSAISALTSRVGQAQLLWTVDASNDFDDTLPADFPMYEGSPMILAEPNRSRTIDTNHVRLVTSIDSPTGLTHRVDSAGRAFSVQAHNWMIQGREQQHNFRRLLYYLRGRQRKAWLPTFNDDVTLTDAAPIGASSVDVSRVGFSYIGGPIPGRSRLWTGKEVVRHAAMGAPGEPEDERMVLAAPTTAAYAPGASWSFLEAVRLDTDTIELTHYADSDGVLETAATFRAFADVREAPQPIVMPAVVAEQSDEWCGEPQDENPCRRVLPDWTWRIIYRAYRTGPINDDPQNAFSHLGGNTVRETSDRAAGYWSFLMYGGPAPGAPGSWTFSFGFGSGGGSTCTRRWDDDYCLGEVYVQHRTMLAPVLAVAGAQYFISPMVYQWTFPQVEVIE